MQTSQRPQMPSLPEWLLRDPLSVLGLLLFALAAFVAVKVAGALLGSPERWALRERATILGFLLLFALILYVTRLRPRWLQWTLARRGDPVMGRVEKVERGSWTVNDVPYVHARYTYVVNGKEFQAWTPERHPDQLGLSRGQQIVVWVDPSRPDRQAWINPNQDHSTMLTEGRIMGSLVDYPGELMFLGSVIFASLLISLFGGDFAEQAHEFARQHDPNMLGLAVGLVLMVASTVIVARINSRTTSLWAQTAVWLALGVGFYGPWAASGFQFGLLAFLLILAVVIRMIANKRKSGRT